MMHLDNDNNPEVIEDGMFLNWNEQLYAGSDLVIEHNHFRRLLNVIDASDDTCGVRVMSIEGSYFVEWLSLSELIIVAGACGRWHKEVLDATGPEDLADELCKVIINRVTDYLHLLDSPSLCQDGIAFVSRYDILCG